MKSYIISYELTSPEREQKKFFEAIEKLGDWWYCFENMYVVKTRLSTNPISDHLKKYIGKEDKMVVAKIKTTVHCGFPDECKAWLLNE